MDLSSIPQKFLKAIASIGETRTIPDASQIGIVNGAASLETGFVPLNRTPVGSGGVPPSIRDMNGFLNRLSNIDRWLCAGGGFTFDSTYATAIGGYPAGAQLLRTDGLGSWLNTVDGNTTNPESAGSIANGWIPVQESGVTSIDVTGLSTTITLSPAQYGKKTIEFFGDLTANIDVVFPAATGQFSTEWIIVNSINITTFSLRFRVNPDTGENTYLNTKSAVVTNVTGGGGGIRTVSSTATISKLSTGATPKTLLKIDPFAFPCLVMVANAAASDWWLLSIYSVGGSVVIKTIDSVVTTANGEAFSVSGNDLRITVTSGTESYFARIYR